MTARDADEDTVHNTDVGNARRLVRGFGDGIRYVPAWGRWLLYDGTRWARDDHEFIVQVAMDIAAEMREQARQTDDKALARWATQSESTARVDAMVRLARTEPRIPLDPDRLDADPWMLNVRNGTVDLHTGKLGEHRAGDLVTKLAPVTFDPSAQCPTWDRFIRQVLGDELGAYVQRAVGYSLTGTVSEQVLFFAYGTGANGKTTMLKTLQHVFGDYTTQATADVLTAADAHPTGIARLQGARLVAATELEDGRRLAEAAVKALTGGDRIVARFMHRDFFEFEPSWAFWLSANHRPQVRGTDHGIWRRIRIIPFTVQIAAEEQDADLPAKLEAEASGILNWVLAGCAKWQENGLSEPLVVTAANREYREDEDVLGAFLAEQCETDLEATVLASALYTAYRRWCEDAGEAPETQTRFGRKLAERGFERRKRGVMIYRGLRLRRVSRDSRDG